MAPNRTPPEASKAEVDARIERRVTLIHQAGEAALVWARVAAVLSIPLGFVLGIPDEALAFARDIAGQ